MMDKLMIRDNDKIMCLDCFESRLRSRKIYGETPSFNVAVMKKYKQRRLCDVCHFFPDEKRSQISAARILSKIKSHGDSAKTELRISF